MAGWQRCRVVFGCGRRGRVLQLTLVWFCLSRIRFDLFDLEIGVNSFNPTISRTNCHTHHMTMSILRLLQIGLPVSGMVGYPTEFLGGAHAAKKRHRQTNLLG